MGFFYMNLSGWLAVTLLFLFFIQNSNYIYGVDLTKVSNFSCAFYMYTRRVTRHIPPWIEAFITFDRYISIAHKTKLIGRILKEKKYVCIIMISLVICLLIVNIDNTSFYLEFSLEIENNMTNFTSISCTSTKDIIFRAKLISSTIRAIIPGLIQIIFGILLVKKVNESKNNLQKHSSLNRLSRKEEIRSNQFSKTVISLNTVFLLLNLPEAILYFINDYVKQTSSDLNLVTLLGDVYLLIYDYSNLYYCLMFFSYMMFNKLFYKELIVILRIDKNANNSTQLKMTSKGTRTAIQDQ